MQEFINQLYELVLFPLLTALGVYLTIFINAKANELKNKAKNETEIKYISRINDIINACVLTTNQTYVEALKKKGEFTLEAQKEAFNQTKEAVLGLMNEELQEFILMSFGDINVYLTSQIEASVNNNKANS